MSAHTRSRYVRSSAPFGLLGVPTQIREKVASPSAQAASVVARNRPAATTSRTSAARPGSTTGLDPRLIRSTFVSLTSTPMTRCPAFAGQAHRHRLKDLEPRASADPQRHDGYRGTLHVGTHVRDATGHHDARPLIG